MKDKLHEILQAIIAGKNKDARSALHEYLTAKTRSILSEEYDEEMVDDYEDEGDLGDELGDDLGDELGDEDEGGDVESRLADVEDRLDDVEASVD